MIFYCGYYNNYDESEIALILGEFGSTILALIISYTLFNEIETSSNYLFISCKVLLLLLLLL